MRDGVVDINIGEVILPIQSEAATAVSQEVEEFTDPMRRPKTEEGEYEPLPYLPYYGEAFQDGRHIIPGDRKEEDKHDDRKYYGGVTNPTVHIALNQIRQVINELIDRYGHPYSIAIELGRELPVGAEGRRDIEKEQKKYQEENQRLDNILRDKKQKITPDNRLRLRLWEESDQEDIAGRCCPFSGNKIGIADLFNGNCEIEHLIPFSISLDDSRSNKVICFRQANRDKNNQTPFQAFGHSPSGYNWHEIFERAKRLPKSKQWRFQEDALDIWKRDHSDFTARHLNDTRYIGRLAREYLENICHIDKIDVLTGRLTALLRGHWGLNSVLPGDENKKNRDDHRHHAVDAIVIGMTTKSMLQRVSTAANRAEELNLCHLIQKKHHKSVIDPWDNFRNAVAEVVNGIIVSHKRSRKPRSHGTTDGKLHNATALGIISRIDPEDIDNAINRKPVEVVTRKPIEKFESREQVEIIRDLRLRTEFLAAFDKAVADGKKGVEGVIKAATNRDKSIRNLRYTQILKVVPIKDKTGEPYKAYKGDSNWGVEIYTFPEGHKKHNKWEGIVISRFDANKSNFKPGETCRPHPASKLIMCLQINDCIEVEYLGYRQIMRLQFVTGGQLVFAEHNEANVDKRNRDKSNMFQYFTKAANVLKSLNARKVHISPTGQVSYESRRKPRRK